MSDWQPMSTAPDDGTEVLVTTDKQEVLIAFFSFNDWQWWDREMARAITPIAWMPRPNPAPEA
jgi:hypothetical protein